MDLVIRQIPRDRVSSNSLESRGYKICKHKRFWQVTDPDGQLVCIAVYRRGAKEVVRRLTA